MSDQMRAETSSRLRVLSLGAGVQSSTLLLMACVGEFEKPDVAIFADTGWEPKAVYAHLRWLEERARLAGIPVQRVGKGNIRDDVMADDHGRVASMPLYLRSKDGGSDGVLRRQCTQEYKLKPIREKVRAHLAYGPHQRIPERSVEMWLGISLDEVLRMKPSREAWIENRWPLIERRMTRGDCVLWLRRHGFPIPPKSSCIGCPFHNDRYWRDLQRGSPEEFADAVAFDAQVRRRVVPWAEVYLHRSLRPLSEVDLASDADKGQALLEFGDECEGMCGL
jgi:hypothetical protein